MVGFALSAAYPGPVQAISKPGAAANPELNVKGLQTQTGPLELTFN